MQASLIYFDSYPNWRVARERLRRAIKFAEVGAVSVVVRVVITDREAVACGLCGSPTILIDGADPFAGVDLQTGIYCRQFTTESGLDVAPSVAQLVAALRRAFHNGVPHGDVPGLARSQATDLPQPVPTRSQDIVASARRSQRPDAFASSIRPSPAPRAAHVRRSRPAFRGL
jgi:hypothetical protein